MELAGGEIENNCNLFPVGILQSWGIELFFDYYIVL